MNRSFDIADRPARVLIVDDERHNRQLLEVMLAPEGYLLETAVSGEEALAMVALDPPDLILLDVMMPGMDGYRVAARIKQDAATRNIPIIMVTALNDRDARLLGLRAGAEDFLTKPVDRAELCVRARNLLRLKAYGDYHDQYSQMLQREVDLRTADLLERTKALEQQAAVLTEQALLLDLAQDAVIVRDMDGRIVFWNRGAEVMYGWTSQEALRHNARAFLSTEFSVAIEEPEAELLRRGHWEGEEIHRTRDGTRLVVASRWALHRDATGAPVRILTIANDVTARKRIDADCLLLTERLSLATAVAEIGVWEWDLATNTLTWDDTMFGIYGLTAVVPMAYDRWSSAVHPDDLPAATRTLQRVIDEKGQGSPGSEEFRIILGDGSLRNIFAVQRVVLDALGNASRVVGVNMDVTERKQQEAALRTARDAAETANRAKSEFLANMSHEIRTPMNGVIGMTDLVLDTTLTPEQREYLEIVKSSADGLLIVINDILDFSRVEAGKLALDPIEFNPRDAVADTANAVALRAHQKGLELIVDVDAGVPHTLRGDAGRLRQILVNLLGNAIKFTQHGEIDLRVTREAAARPDVVLHFSVRDTGVGIPLDRQKSVFEAFTQADGSMSRTYGGTGLGLTISSQLVQLMGGRLWVESEPGNGSTFHFTVRFSLMRPAAPAPVPDPVELRDLHVLVVDDNATNRRLLEEVLIGWDLVPTLKATVPDALSSLRAALESGSPFPLVLTDAQMPNQDGFALAEAIKMDPAIAGATVVMLTSAGKPGDAARCRELGIAAYLAKPVRRSELYEAIREALSFASAEQDRRQALVTRHSLREARQAGRILLVEDNRVNQLVARRLLEKRGHVVVVANNGLEALAILDESAFQGFGCVLMDIQMPEMDGCECTATIRDREQVTRTHLQIVAMTAHAMTGDRERCLAAGMDGYLTKPFLPDEFFELIDRHLAVSRVPTARPAPSARER